MTDSTDTAPPQDHADPPALAAVSWAPDYPQKHPVDPYGMGYNAHSNSKLWTCQRCGSVVADIPLHDTWHRHVEEAKR